MNIEDSLELAFGSAPDNTAASGQPNQDQALERPAKKPSRKAAQPKESPPVPTPVQEIEPEEEVSEAIVDSDVEDLADEFGEGEPEEKRGFFRRAKKEKKEAPKPVSAPKNQVQSAPKIPESVLDIMLRNNQGIKKCFIEERRNSGKLPSGISVLFSLQPSGKVTTMQIAKGDYINSPFEKCLRTAFRGIQFPSFEGSESQRLRYKFKI